MEEFAEMEHTPGEDGKPRYPECLYCQWVPTIDGIGIGWDGGEKFYCWLEWLTYLIERFLKPWVYSLNDEVRWIGDGETNYSGRRKKDQGLIIVRDNAVETIDDPDEPDTSLPLTNRVRTSSALADAGKTRERERRGRMTFGIYPDQQSPLATIPLTSTGIQFIE